MKAFGGAVFVVWALPGTAMVSAAGSSHWFVSEQEYNFVEGITLIPLICLAIGFELIWHSSHHSAEHSYSFGMSEAKITHSSSEEASEHVQLFKELRNRMGGEFMSLGFLAFSIFWSNQAGIFQFFAEVAPGCANKTTYPLDKDAWHLPCDAHDWLHMFEVMHMKLFIGMMLYFVLAGGIVKGSVHRIRKWERMQALFNEASWDKSAVLHTDYELQQLPLMHKCFLHQIIEWRSSHSEVFNCVLRKLGVDPASVDVLSEESRLQILSKLEQRFVISAYLALNVEHCIKESIEVHTFSWLSILLLFGCFTMLHRYAAVTLPQLMPAIVACAFLVVAIMVFFIRCRKASLQNLLDRDLGGSEAETKSASVSSSQCRASRKFKADVTGSGRICTERVYLRFLQIFMFLISYCFAQTLADPHEWQEPFELTLLAFLGFSLLFILMLNILPHYVPIFIQLMSLPPFVDEDNLKLIFAVLGETDVEGSSKQPKKALAQTTSRAAVNEPEPSVVAVSQLADILQSFERFEDLKGLRKALDQRLCASGCVLSAPSDQHLPV